jgi:photosystem II stability/assembly factor-like uncharacterized protein
MKKYIGLVLSLLLLYSCKPMMEKAVSPGDVVYDSIEIEQLIKDTISIRAIALDGNKIWYAANKSRFGYYDLNSNKRFEKKISKDSLSLEFRSIAQTESTIFILNIGNPALLYKISKASNEINTVYQESNEKVFYDSMQFWNNKEGIAMGDPIDDCLSVVITRDGGNSWNKISCDLLPKVEAGEAAFAASNTNIVIKGANCWIVTGGKKARVLFSSDKGNSWNVVDTPIVQGSAMTGIFTADFYNESLGFIAGGNYDSPKQNYGNKAQTLNGGKTWELIAENQGFGYASCVQYFPESDGKSLLSVGSSGIYYSYDGGKSWKQLSDDPNLYTVRFMNNNTAIAAGKNKLIKIIFKK